MSEEKYAKIISKNLRRIMSDKGLTQAEVSRALKINKATLSSWMNGTRIPRMQNIDMLCHYFNVTRAEIMEDVQEIGQDKQYYLDQEAREIADFMSKNPEYKTLFEASRKLKKDDLQFIMDMIERMS